MNKLAIFTLTVVFSSLVTASEKTSFKAIDLNLDGLISLTEAEHTQGLLTAFPDLDVNQDGDLTEIEYKKFAMLFLPKDNSFSRRSSSD